MKAIDFFRVGITLMLTLMTRAKKTTIEDKLIHGWFSEHVKLADAKASDMFPYKKSKHSQSPSWECMNKNRNALMDLAILSRGQLLKMAPFEKQFLNFMEAHKPGEFDENSASVVTGHVTKYVFKQYISF